MRAAEPESEAIALSLLGPVPQAARRLQFTGRFPVYVFERSGGVPGSLSTALNLADFFLS